MNVLKKHNDHETYAVLNTASFLIRFDYVCNWGCTDIHSTTCCSLNNNNKLFAFENCCGMRRKQLHKQSKLILRDPHASVHDINILLNIAMYCITNYRYMPGSYICTSFFLQKNTESMELSNEKSNIC